MTLRISDIFTINDWKLVLTGFSKTQVYLRLDCIFAISHTINAFIEYDHDYKSMVVVQYF